ncbi:MAG: site-specific integrase [Acidobacteria bacterium]|nr:site-specific integrase [Acidobacteriota bacterium]
MPPRRVTYADVFESWLAWCAARARRPIAPGTTGSYRRHGRRLLADWGPRAIAATTGAAVERWVADCRAAGLADATINRRLVVLRGLMRHALRERRVRRLPCVVPHLDEPPTSERDRLSREDTARLLAASDADPDPAVRALVRLFADAGLRRAEPCLIRGENVTLAAGRRGCGWIRVPARSRRERPKARCARDVPILTRELHEALAALDPRQGEPLVRGLRDGDSVRRRIARAWRAALGTAPQPHRLRHGWITDLLQAGEPAVNVMAWAGHRNLATTLRYTHAAGEPTARARAALRRRPAERR